jgi:hypothetical protein
MGISVMRLSRQRAINALPVKDLFSKNNYGCMPDTVYLSACELLGQLPCKAVAEVIYIQLHRHLNDKVETETCKTSVVE